MMRSGDERIPYEGSPDGRDALEKGRLSGDQFGHRGDREEQQPPSVSNSPGRFSISHRNSSVKVDSSFVVDIQSPLRDPSEKKRSDSAGPLPITLKFEDVEYSVNIKAQSSWFELKSWSLKSMVPSMFSKEKGGGGGGKKKEILHGVNGIVKPGEILAMLGPSGSGKTTVLNILGGRIKGKIRGKVLYNDSALSRGMKRRTGFVTQDDVLFPHLTVRETLVYAAYLRLPASEFTKAAKVERAEAVIAELGLEKCKDTIIGGGLVRGVSGGERKRVSIGHEMLIDPSLLLLDEPTSGLDSTIALKIIHTLQDLAKGGRTVVTTIHQPSSIIFHTFSKLLLLSEGSTLYYGAGSDAMNYFESVGYKPSFASNPADFLLDLANGLTYDITDANNEDQLTEAAMKKTKSTSALGPKELLQTLREAYTKILLPKTLQSIAESPALTEAEYKASREKRDWPTSWFDQFRILTERGIKERRHEAFAGLRIGQVVVISIICGLLWWQSSPDKIQDQVGLIFFLTTFWGFFPVFSAIFTFPTERQMLMKERASGMYRLSAYFVARTLGDLPLDLVLPVISVIIVYWMGGLRPTAGAFFATMCIIVLIVLVSQGMGLLLGAVLMNIKKATTLSSVVLLTFQLAGGYFVQSTPAWIGWIKYLSYAYFAFKLQLAAQYTSSMTYPCGTGRCLIVEYPAIETVGIANWGISLMAMLLMLVGYRVLSYLALRRMKI